MKTFAKRFFSAAALASATLAGAPAFAGDVDFAYSASEMRNSAAISDLYERIEEKAWRACAVYENSGLLGIAYQRACAADLMADFVDGIDNAKLTALHEERHGARLAESF